MLVNRGRLKPTMDVAAWIALSESLPALRFVPVDNGIAVRSIFLPNCRNRDPADRVIIATALSLEKTVITKDRKIRSYAGVASAW
jgi:PIN domain nuclease of toxin-antitoxin system